MTPIELQAARNSLGITQAQLAEVIGVARGHVTRLETGKKQITQATALLVRALVTFGLPDTWPQIDKAVQDAAQDVERVKAESGKVPRERRLT